MTERIAEALMISWVILWGWPSSLMTVYDMALSSPVANEACYRRRPNLIGALKRKVLRFGLMEYLLMGFVSLVLSGSLGRLGRED